MAKQGQGGQGGVSGPKSAARTSRAPRELAEPARASGVGVSKDFHSTTGMRSRVRTKGASIAPPPQPRFLQSLIALSRSAATALREDDVLRIYLNGLSEILPTRWIAIQLLDPETGGPKPATANAATPHATSECFMMTRAAVELHELQLNRNLHAHVELTDSYTPIFDTRALGFDVPLVDGERFIGSLSIEYPPGTQPDANDINVAVPIAVQLAQQLGNVHLLRESMYLRDYLSKLLDHASAPILVVGRNREIRVINKTLRTLTGLVRENLVGRDFILMLPENQRDRMLAAFDSAVRGESMANVEVVLPRATGGTTRLAVNVAAILRPDGEVEAVIAIGRDLTAVRELEEQVIQSEKLATLGQLAAGVVHELNNPLTSISVYADYLLKKSEKAQNDANDTEKLRRILESADRILNFTRDLVTYARPSSEQPKEISVRDVLDQAVVFCEHVITERGVVVEKSYAESLGSIQAVRSQMHQVFINLITNACHAMPQDAGKLFIEASMTRDGRVRVRVQDNGTGIRPGDADRVFEPFFTTKGEGKGTGLGLSIVRNIVQQHHGEISVESEIGRGTTFSVILDCGKKP